MTNVVIDLTESDDDDNETIAQLPLKQTQWRCSTCTFFNDNNGFLSKCEICDKDRVFGSSSSSSSSSSDTDQVVEIDQVTTTTTEKDKVVNQAMEVKVRKRPMDFNKGNEEGGNENYPKNKRPLFDESQKSS